MPGSWKNRDVGMTSVDKRSEFWLKEFNQPGLHDFLNEAFENNPTINAQAAAVKLAQLQIKLTNADRKPQLSTGLAASRNKRSSSSGYSISSKYSTTYNFHLDFDWEIDLWNRLGNAVKATIYDAKATQSDFDAAQLSLAANIIKTWLDAIEAQQQLQLTRKTFDNFSSVLDIVERGYDRGLYRALDVRLARTNVSNADSKLQIAKRLKNQAVSSLEVLLGRYPSSTLELPALLPSLIKTIPVGVPGTLLNRRPDIAAAMARFKAFDQRYIQTKKNRLFALRLTGSGGTSTQELRDLLDPDSLVWNVVSGLAQPIFQGGRLNALRDEAEIRLEQAEYYYRQTVLTALQEVETLLSAETTLQDEESATALTVHESAQAEILASEDYVVGLTDINTLLQTQRQTFIAKSALLSIKKTRLHNRVNLYLALGGPISEPEFTSAEINGQKQQ